MRAALLLALAALPPARASAATCHTYTPAEQADATLMCAAAIDYDFAVPAGFHPDEAARALVGGDDAAESARLHASLDAPCKAALKKLTCSCRRPFFSSPAADAPTLGTRRGRVDGVFMKPRRLDAVDVWRGASSAVHLHAIDAPH